MRVVSRLIRTCSILALCAGASSFAACSTTADAQEASQSEGVVRTQASAHSSKIFDKALDEVKLRPEQQTEVDKLRADSKERHAPVKAAKRELMRALADEIETGNVDECALRPALDKFAAAVAKANPEDRASLEKLHAILDPDQRTAFVDALREEFKTIREAHDKNVMSEAISKALNLTDDQKERLSKIFSGLKQIKEAEPGMSDHKERMNKILDAFKGDHFVMDEIEPAKDVEQKVIRKMKHLLWAGEAVLPVLDETQRGQVAKFLREKSEHKEHKEHGDEHGAAAQDQAPPQHEDESGED